MNKDNKQKDNSLVNNHNDDVEMLLENDKDFKINMHEYFDESSLFNMPAYQLQYIKDGLRSKYLMLSKGGKFKYNVAKKKDGYLFHVLIPSESVTNVLFDVVLELTLPENPHATNLMRYNVKFFCNSPSFTYTYAYAMEQNGVFADAYKDKLDKIFFKKPPIDRNPGLSIGYEKFTYMAYEYLNDLGLFKLTELEKTVKFVSERDIHSAIPDFNTKMAEYELKRKAMFETDKQLRNKRAVKSNATRSKSTTLKSKSGTSSTTKNATFLNGGKSKTTSKGKIKPKSKITGKKKIGR